MWRALPLTLLLILLLTSTGLVVAFWLEGSRLRLAADQARTERLEERQELQKTIVDLRKAVTDLQKERTSREEGLQRETRWLSISSFPDLDEWKYPGSLPQFTGGKVSRALGGLQFEGRFHNSSPDVYTSGDDFNKVVVWYRARLEAFMKQTGNDIPDLPGWSSVVRSKPEPLGIYVFQKKHDDKADEVRMATLGIRAAGGSLTVFVAQSPGGGAASRTRITLVRDRAEIRYQPPKPIEIDPGLMTDKP
jgi:hypothetical protein